MHVCEAARKSCFMLDMKKTVNKMTIDELDDEERQQGEEWRYHFKIKTYS